jgi:hypothetical protein
VELLVAIDAVDDVIARAKPTLLHGEDVFIDAEAFAAAIARLRAAIGVDLPDVVAPRVAGPIGRLERICADAAPHRRGSQVNRAAVYDELDEARQLAIADIRTQRAR